jgi:hypothetical protein
MLFMCTFGYIQLVRILYSYLYKYYEKINLRCNCKLAAEDLARGKRTALGL